MCMPNLYIPLIVGFSNLCGIIEFIVNKNLHLPPHNGQDLVVLVVKENTTAGPGGLEISYLVKFNFFTLQIERSKFIVKHFEEKYTMGGGGRSHCRKHFNCMFSFPSVGFLRLDGLCSRKHYIITFTPWMIIISSIFT